MFSGRGGSFSGRAASAAAAAAAATTDTTPRPANFIRFASGTHAHVSSDRMWTDDTALGTSWLRRFMVRPQVGAADGYFLTSNLASSNHPAIDGFSSVGSMKAPIGGQFNSSGVMAYKTALFGPVEDEWAEITDEGYYVAGGIFQIFRVNGLIVGSYLWANFGSGITRKAPPAGQGAGKMYVNHSNHQPAGADIAAMQFFESVNPLTTLTHVFWPFKPSRSYSKIFDPFDSGDLAEGLWVFNAPGATIPDLSDGYNGGTGATKYRHPLRLGNGDNEDGAHSTGVFPTFDFDEDLPFGQGGNITNSVRNAYVDSLSARTIESGTAKIYDSFQKHPSDLLWYPNGNGGLGATDSRGSLGAKTWLYTMLNGAAQEPTAHPSGELFCISCELARVLDPQPAIAYVTNDSADAVVYIKRASDDVAASGNMGCTGMVGRMQNNANFIGVWTPNYPDGTVHLMDYQGGVQVANSGAATGFGYSVGGNTAFRWIRVTFSGTTVSVAIDNGAFSGWTTIGTYTDSVHNAQTKFGLSNLGGAGNSGGSWNCQGFIVT